MAKGVWLRSGAHAIPADERSLEFLQAQKDGEPFIAETHGARNVKQLRLWWVLARLIGDQLDLTAEVVSDDVKIALGYSETRQTLGGQMIVKPASIAFESMTQEQFNPLFQAAVNKYAEWLGSSRKEVLEAFNEKVGDKRYGGMRR